MKLVNFFACDDIRFEQNNKVSIIGLYSDSIIFESEPGAPTQWPMAMKLGLYARFEVDREVGEGPPKKFELYVTQGKESVKVAGGDLIEPEDKTDRLFNLALVHPAMIFKAPGELAFKFIFFNSSGERLGEFPAPPIKIVVRPKRK